MIALSSLESEALGLLLAGNHPALAVLRSQHAVAHPAGRQETGTGILVTFEVPADAPRLGSLSFILRDVGADVGETPCGFILSVRDGALDTLEGHTWVGSWPAAAPEFSLHYLRLANPGDPRLVRIGQRALEDLELP